ncbi:hypothetical protein [Methyloglobulus sp.]|uniref:hypothetical protein n=1 Tax=Methyloglobulus sp. TaxID=2518622 RepID=UPI0032B842C5
MRFIKLGAAFSLSFFLWGNAHAAGAPVNEDFSVVSSLCDDMVELAKKGSKEEFIEIADSALRLSEAQRRDNSMAIDRFRPKLRAAKKAGKSGDFDAAIGFVQEAKTLMKPATASWDGGS